MNITQTIQDVAEATGVPANAITGPTRHRSIAYARFLACAALRQRIPWITHEGIAAAVGRCDHGASIYAIKRHAEMCQTDKTYRLQAEALGVATN